MLNYNGTESLVGHKDDYPLNFVENTVELPCSKVTMTMTMMIMIMMTTMTMTTMAQR